MAPVRHWTDDDEIAAANRRTESLAGLAMALLIIVVGLYLARALHREAALQDCLMSGRVVCGATIETAE